MDYSLLTALIKDAESAARQPRDEHGRWADDGPGAGSPRGGREQQPTRSRRVSEQVPRESAKAILARQTSRLVDADVQRYSEERCEPQLAKMLGGVSLKDNEPVDVMVVEGGVVKHGVELKVMTDNKNDKITMKDDAIRRKLSWTRQNRADFHVVVFDDQLVKDAHGPGSHDETKRRIFYRRGWGSPRVSKMHEVTGGISELKRLMSTKTSELPDAAKPASKVPYPRIRPRAWMRELGVGFFLPGRIVRYSPDQPRDAEGRFGEGSGGGIRSGDRSDLAPEEYVKLITSDKEMRDGVSAWIADQTSIKDAQKEGREDELVRGFERAVEAAPHYDGDAWRGLRRLTAEQATEMTVPGAEITDACHSSWTKDGVTAKAFAGSSKTPGFSVILHTKGASSIRDIDPLDEIGEKEVISPKGTRYKVLSARREGSTYHVEVEESR